MAETCKFCKKDLNSGIWLSPQFTDEKVLLFCSEECKEEYLKKKTRPNTSKVFLALFQNDSALPKGDAPNMTTPQIFTHAGKEQKR